MRLKQKIILVTGGSRGIGKAVAERLAGEGALVIASSRTAPPLSASGGSPLGSVIPALLDVTEERSVTALFAAIDARFGRLDGLINNAGVGVFKPIEALSLEEWNRVIATNLTGTFLCSREAFRRMKAGGGGRILNLGSIADHTALPTNGAYGTSKFGVRGLNGTLNEEGKSFQIRSTLLSLGAVATEIWQDRTGFNLADMLSAADVAETVLHVVSQPLTIRIDELKLYPSKGLL